MESAYFHSERQGTFFSHEQIRRMNEWEIAQSCPTLCDPMDCSLPGSSVHGIFQARILEWVAIFFSKSGITLKAEMQVTSRWKMDCLCLILTS